MPGRVCQLQRYVLLDVVVAQATLLGDRVLELITDAADFGISGNRAFAPEIPHTLQVWSGTPKDNGRV